jgi:hypothetical protein
VKVFIFFEKFVFLFSLAVVYCFKIAFWKINGNCLTLKAIDEEESFPGKVLLTEQS